MRLGVGLRYDIMVILRGNGCIQRKSNLAHCPTHRFRDFVRS
jgi:hypothetical protein